MKSVLADQEEAVVLGTTSAPPQRDGGVVVRDIHKSFGDTKALTGCSLTARLGEIHAILGENGSGKSTLVKIISGILRADRGEVVVLGQPVQSLGPREVATLGVATVFQEVLVADFGSVVENIFLGYDGLLRRRLAPPEKLGRCTALMRRLAGEEVDPYIPVESLPLSTRQWVVIARALVREPKVLILDESTAALDLENTRSLFNELEALKAQGTCVLLVTHRIKELSAIADRATVLRDGASVATLQKQEISEAKLLELMTGEVGRRSQGSLRPQRRESSRGRLGRQVLVGEDLRIRSTSGPFSFELREGEIVGLAGLEGHGHVEFIEILAGIRQPAEGSVLVPDEQGGTTFRDVRDAAKHGVVYVPGDRKAEGIFPHLSILENFGLPTYRHHSVAGSFVRFRSVKRRFEEFLKVLGVRLDSPGDLITSLSGGNQQKVILARWLAARPKVLLLNDPTRGVDIATKQDLYALFRAIADEAETVVFLSSEIEEFEDLCDRVLVFRERTLGTSLAGKEATTDRVLAALFGAEQAEEVEEIIAGGAGDTMR